MNREDAEAMAARMTEKWRGRGARYEAVETAQASLLELADDRGTGGWYVRRIVDRSERGEGVAPQRAES